MQIEHLKECVHLSETRNFTETAKAFFRTQPVLSKHIAALEQEVGVKLFLRSRNGLELTDAGAIFIEDAKKVLEDHRLMLNHARRTGNNERDTLRVGYLYGASFDFLPSATRTFLKTHKDIDVSFTPANFDAAFAAMNTDTIDMGIVPSFGKSTLLDTGRFVWTKLYDDPLCIICHSKHPLAKKQELTLDDLQGESLMMPIPISTDTVDELFRNLYDRLSGSCKIIESPFDIMSWDIMISAYNYPCLCFRHQARSSVNRNFVAIPITGLGQEYDNAIGVAWTTVSNSETKVSFAQALLEASAYLRQED